MQSIIQITIYTLKQQLFNLGLDGLDLSRQLRSFVGKDAATNNRTRYSTSSTQSNFGRNENIANILQEIINILKMKKTIIK